MWGRSWAGNGQRRGGWSRHSGAHGGPDRVWGSDERERGGERLGTERCVAYTGVCCTTTAHRPRAASLWGPAGP